LGDDGAVEIEEKKEEGGWFHFDGLHFECKWERVGGGKGSGVVRGQSKVIDGREQRNRTDTKNGCHTGQMRLKSDSVNEVYGPNSK